MNFKKMVLFLLIGFLFSFSHILSATLSDMQIKVYFDTKEQWLKLLSKNLDIVFKGDNYIEIFTNQNELDQLNSLGFRTEVVHTSVSLFYQTRLAKTRLMGGYKTLSEIYAYLDTLILEHSIIVSNKINIGNTIEGRPMWAVKISDNPNVDEDEPEVLYFAAIHAREVITPEILIYFINYLVNNYGTDPEVTYLVDNRELWFVLVVNPDGYYHNQVTNPSGGGTWRKNRRNNGDGTYGVDLNRNYGYEWGHDNVGSSPTPGNETYRGTGPFSEPETQHMRDFINSHPFVITVSYHSYSNLIIWPWGYDRIYTPDEDIFATLGDSMNAFNGYSPGVGWTLYLTNGDSDDWGYGEQSTKSKNFAYTLEVGSQSDGFWPNPSRIPALVSENLGPNLFSARVAGNVYALKAPKTPILILADTVDASNYNVVWTFYDTLSSAKNFELVELQNYQRVKDSAASFGNWTNKGFSVSTARNHSAPTSFYSGSFDNLREYFQFKNSLLLLSGDSLKFWTYYNIETDWDYAYVEVSTDGMNFSPIPGNITTNYNPNGANRGNGITGSSSGWVQGLFNLSSYVGQNIYIRFSYYTDEALHYEGFYVDDIYPVPKYGLENVISSTLTDTLYNFTDKPAGTYYYKVRVKDTQNQWSIFSPIKKTYAKGTFLCGDVNIDSVIDIGDIVYLINYVFYGGPVPALVQSGDVNNDATVDIGDIIYLINYVFYGGTAPNCG
jgi:hypothetical protein